MKKSCLIMLVMLTACATKPVWVKPGASPSDFGAAKYSCMQSSMEAAPAVAGVNAYGSSSNNLYGGSGVFAAKTQDINAAARDQMFKACMESKGWSLQKPGPPPPTVPDAEVSLEKVELGTLNNPRMIQAGNEAKKCIQNRKDGIFNYKESAECVNNAVKQGFMDVGYPYMDLVDSLNSTRLSCAVKEDANKMTDVEAKKVMKKKIAELALEEGKRKSDENVAGSSLNE